MSPWVQLLVSLIVEAAKTIPEVVRAVVKIVDSGSMTPEEKKAALDLLRAELENDIARVQAVQFRKDP